MAATLLYLFYTVGLANNGYLLFRLCKSWSSPASKSFNLFVSFQIFLNICNIITHAAVLEHSKQFYWQVLSANFSFLSIYFLAAMVVSIAAGRPLQQRLNSILSIFIFTALTLCSFAVFERKYKEVCVSGNCFSLNLANTEDHRAIAYRSIAHFWLPSFVIFIGSWYYGFSKCYAQETDEKEPIQSSVLYRLVRVGLSSPVLLFIIYGIVVVDAILYFNERNAEITLPNRLCRMNCLNEDLYVLLSIFPVYIGHFIKKRELGRQQPSLETWGGTWPGNGAKYWNGILISCTESTSDKFWCRSTWLIILNNDMASCLVSQINITAAEPLSAVDATVTVCPTCQFNTEV